MKKRERKGTLTYAQGPSVNKLNYLLPTEEGWSSMPRGSVGPS